MLCRQGDTVIISGRSIGGINVQRILEKLTAAGMRPLRAHSLRGSINRPRPMSCGRRLKNIKRRAKQMKVILTEDVKGKGKREIS